MSAKVVIATGNATEGITISVKCIGITGTTGVIVMTRTITSEIGIATTATGATGDDDNRIAATVITVTVPESRWLLAVSAAATVDSWHRRNRSWVWLSKYHGRGAFRLLRLDNLGFLASSGSQEAVVAGFADL
jgi:hypothetical protein